MYEVFVTVMCIGILANTTDARRKCLNGAQLDQPLDTTTVTKCGEHEVCYVQKYTTDDGVTLFDVGCQDPRLCAASSNPQPVGRRYVNGSKRDVTIVCHQCCDNKDLCNIDGHCGSIKFNPPTGQKLCYQCHKAGSPDECTNIGLCDQDNSCSINKETNILGVSKWTSGCSRHVQCSATIGSKYCCNSSLCNSLCHTATSVVKRSCPSNWISWCNKCLLFSSVDKSWMDAERYCNSLHGHLVELKDSATNTFVKDHLKAMNGNNHVYFVGATDFAKEGSWIWHKSNTHATFFDWGVDQIPFVANHHENCLTLDFHENFVWHDYPCQDKLHFICEK